MTSIPQVAPDGPDTEVTIPDWLRAATEQRTHEVPNEDTPQVSTPSEDSTENNSLKNEVYSDTPDIPDWMETPLSEVDPFQIDSAEIDKN